MGQPHNKHQHLFVVVRLSKRLQTTEDLDVSEDVMLTKVFFEQEEAEREASRLNELNEEFWHYFVCTARLVDSAGDERS